MRGKENRTERDETVPCAVLLKVNTPLTDVSQSPANVLDVALASPTFRMQFQSVSNTYRFESRTIDAAMVAVTLRNTGGTEANTSDFENVAAVPAPSAGVGVADVHHCPAKFSRTDVAKLKRRMRPKSVTNSSKRTDAETSTGANVA